MGGKNNIHNKNNDNNNEDKNNDNDKEDRNNDDNKNNDADNNKECTTKRSTCDWSISSRTSVDCSCDYSCVRHGKKTQVRIHYYNVLLNV